MYTIKEIIERLEQLDTRTEAAMERLLNTNVQRDGWQHIYGHLSSIRAAAGLVLEDFRADAPKGSRLGTETEHAMLRVETDRLTVLLTRARERGMILEPDVTPAR